MIDAARTPGFPAEIALVISNKADAYGLKRAELAEIPALVVDHNSLKVVNHLITRCTWRCKSMRLKLSVWRDLCVYFRRGL